MQVGGCSASFMNPPTFLIKPHTSHKKCTVSMLLQILEERTRLVRAGRIPDPSKLSEGCGHVRLHDRGGNEGSVR